jgi:nitrogen fixation/metabolism regulation signal transduction histidine kinase
LIAALGVGVTAIMGGFLYRAHVTNTRVLELANEELRLQVARNDQLFLLYLVLLVVGMAFVLSIWGIIVTHRISGPLYLVARYLGILGGGQYPDMRPLRKRDELQEFFTTFEEAVNQLKARDQSNLAALEAALTAATAAADKAAAAQILTDVVQKQRDQLNKMLKA